MADLGDELRRKGVAAGTIRDALGDWHSREAERLIAAIAKAPSDLPTLLGLQAEVKAYYRLDKELVGAMNRGIVED